MQTRSKRTLQESGEGSMEKQKGVGELIDEVLGPVRAIQKLEAVLIAIAHKKAREETLRAKVQEASKKNPIGIAVKEIEV